MEKAPLLNGDIKQMIPFFCKIGKVKAIIFVHIEPTVFDNPKLAHFHAGVICPKIKIVEVPEPDRCKVTNNTCPFEEPFGSHMRDEESRKEYYASKIILTAAYFEQYGMKKILNYLVSRKIKVDENKIPKFSLGQIIDLLFAFKLVNNEIYSKLNQIKKVRNELAHIPEAYHKFKEKKLFKILTIAFNCLNELK